MPAPTTAEDSSTTFIRYPSSYRDAPEAYKPILNALYKFVQAAHHNGSIEWHDSWAIIKFTELPCDARMNSDGHIDKYIDNSLGYAVADINNDGTPELLLIENKSWLNPKEIFVHSLFTLKDNEPVHLRSYWSSGYSRFAADGTIYTVSSPRGEAPSALAPINWNPMRLNSRN